jgi:N-acetylmuramoyl-L-alanine amidase
MPNNLKERREYEGKKNYYSDRFSGYAIFVSNDNADRTGSLAFGHSLGQSCRSAGYTTRRTIHFRLWGDSAVN